MEYTIKQFSFIEAKYIKFGYKNPDYLRTGDITFLDPSKTILLYLLFMENLAALRRSGVFVTETLNKSFFQVYQDEKFPLVDPDFFVPQEILKERLIESGLHLPILRNANGSLISGNNSRYRINALYSLCVNNLIPNFDILSIHEHTVGVVVDFNMEVTTKSFDELYNILNVTLVQQNEDISLINITDSVDAWLIFSTMHKELSLLLSKHYEILGSILPYEEIFRWV